MTCCKKRTADVLCYVLPQIKNWWPFCSEQLQKQIMHKNKLIDTSTTINLYLKFKENNENDMAAQVFWTVFHSSRRPSQSGPTVYFNGPAIPPPTFSMVHSNLWWLVWGRNQMYGTCLSTHNAKKLVWNSYTKQTTGSLRAFCPNV